MTTSPLGKARTVKKTFSRTTSIKQCINVKASILWMLLTNAKNFPLWNTTVISIEGDIAIGNKIKLKSTLDPKRTFTLKVKEFVPNKRLVWGDAMGNRTFVLEEQEEHTFLLMTETIGGPLFPLFAGKIPSFDESFEQFIIDIKQEAENQ